MKTILMAVLILIVLGLTACTPAATPVPATETAVPATFTPLPPTATITPIPTPETIADAKNLPVWVNEYIHAYGGKVVVNGVDLDAEQLTGELRSNGDAYMVSKEINGASIDFLVVNGVPLAMRRDLLWQEATMAKLSTLAGVEFEYGWDTRDLPHKDILQKMFPENVTVIYMGDFQMDHLFGEFTQSDWKFVLENWDEVRAGLDKGSLPDKLPYNWYLPDKGIREARQIFANPQFRAQHLLWSFWESTNDVAAIIDQMELDSAGMLKLLEFMVRARVIKYQEVDKWNVSDEIDLTHFRWTDPQDILWQYQIEYWTENTGMSPAEITALIARWVKRDNPQAKTYVIQDNQFDNINPEAQWTRDGFEKFVPELSKLDAEVDYFVIENNLWIYTQPDLQYVSDRIDWIRSYGFDIGGSETMIVIGDEPINPSPRRVKVNPVTDPKLEQAKMYAEWLNLYLDKGIRIFGFGGATDDTAWTNAVGQESADPLLFDDNFRAKPAYYAIVQVLYKRLP